MEKMTVFLLGILFFGSCNHQRQIDAHSGSRAPNYESPIKKHLKEKDSISPSISAILALRDDEFIAVLEKLKISYIAHRNERSLDTLNAIACRSDASFSEAVSFTCVAIFDSKKINFISDITKKTECCLRPALTRGLSADLSIYEGEERVREVKRYRKKLTDLLNNPSFTKEQKRRIEKLAADIDPSVYD